MAGGAALTDGGTGLMGAFSSLVAAGLTTLAIGKATRALVDDTRVQFQGEQVYPSCRTPDTAEAVLGWVSSTPDPLPQLLPMPSPTGARRLR